MFAIPHLPPLAHVSDESEDDYDESEESSSDEEDTDSSDDEDSGVDLYPVRGRGKRSIRSSIRRLPFKVSLYIQG